MDENMNITATAGEENKPEEVLLLTDSADNAGSDESPAADTDTAETAPAASEEISADVPADVSDSTADDTTPDDGKKDSLSGKDITSYTASLWKYKDIPQDEPEPFPEYLTLSEKYEGSELIAARVRGKKHKHEGTNCDDWFEAACEGNITFIAVSDGAGSRKFSRIGARESCRAAVGYMKHTFADIMKEEPDIISVLSLDLSDEKCMAACRRLAKIVQDSVVKAYNAVENAFYDRVTDSRYSDIVGRKLDLRDFSATLLVSAVIPLITENFEKLVISCQIGDGIAALVNTSTGYDKAVKLMGAPDSGEFSGETEFITSKRLLDGLEARTKLSRGTSDILMLMTDGVADDYFPNETRIGCLYLDLLANGILTVKEPVNTDELSAHQLDMIKKLPEPAVYPWVNDNNVKIALNYTDELCGSIGIAPEELWDEREIISAAAAAVRDRMDTDDPAERLKIWLDSYVRRGSFDDRTLVLALI